MLLDISSESLTSMCCTNTRLQTLQYAQSCFSLDTSEQIVAYMDIRPHELGLPPFSDMIDNRDVTVMRSYDPLDRIFHADMQRQSFTEEVCSTLQ